jgi:adenylyl-sulfate kinase
MSQPPSRIDRERLVGHGALVVWLTGLSGAGKTTLARALESALHERGRLCAVLDGDEVRKGLNAGLGFSEEDRTENLRRIAEVARVLLDTGVIVIVAVISPGRAMREQARRIIGPSDTLEVHVRCPVDVCRARDVKGLYRDAAAGVVQQFTGVTAPYEPPESPDLVIDTDRTSLAEAACSLVQAVEARLGRP